MTSNNRKMLFPNQPGQSYTFTFVIPWSQIYPPPPPPPPPPQKDITVLVSTSICIIGSFLLFLFLTVFLYLYITRSRQSSPSAAVAPVSSTNRREEENSEERRDGDLSRYHPVWRITTSGLQRSAIDSITVVVFKNGEGIIDGTDCSVCLSEFEEDEELRLLPKCRHAFHVSCIDMWLLSHKNCPLCRSPVFSTEPRNKKTEMNQHQSESVTSNGEEEEQESSGSRNANALPRSQSDLARHCGGSGGRLETVRRSFSIGGSSLVKDDVGGRSRRQFYSSFSARFFSRA